MVCVNVNLTLSDSLAREAEEKGLLLPQAIESLVREELKRRRVEELFTGLDRLDQAEFPPLTQEQVQIEIDAARAERRSGRAGRD